MKNHVLRIHNSSQVCWYVIWGWEGYLIIASFGSKPQIVLEHSSISIKHADRIYVRPSEQVSSCSFTCFLFPEEKKVNQRKN